MTLLPVETALKRLLDSASRLEAETVSIAEASSRVLARPVKALRTQPPFAASAMDGYAVQAADTGSADTALEVIGESAAGHGYDGKMEAGQTVRIFTGAPVPEGADAILIQENAVSAGNGRITATKPAASGAFVRPAGLDFAEGEALLEAGRMLDPAALSLAAAANHPELAVVRRPKVAILATGDELLPPGSAPGPSQIIASNSYGVAAVAAADGALPLDLGIVADDEDAIAGAISRACTDNADVIVTLGGASVGDHDLVGRVLERLGMRLDFWKIAMRPGKPLMVGMLGNIHVLGLPGNPVSSLVCSELFLRPLLAKLGGRAYAPDIRQARLTTPMPANDLREDYVRARLSQADDELEATPFGRQDSSMLKTLAAAQGLIVRKPHAEAAETGDICQVRLLRKDFR